MKETETKRIGRYYKLQSVLVNKIDEEAQTSGLRKEAIIELALKRFFKNRKPKM